MISFEALRWLAPAFLAGLVNVWPLSAATYTKWEFQLSLSRPLVPGKPIFQTGRDSGRIADRLDLENDLAIRKLDGNLVAYRFTEQRSRHR